MREKVQRMKINKKGLDLIKEFEGCQLKAYKDVAGEKFTAAVTRFQKANGCTADGEITAKGKTWRKLLGMK